MYRRLLAIAEAGLYYGKDEFDKERYQELKELSLELLSRVGQESVAELSQLTEQNEGYPTPKVDVRAYIIQEDKVLLVEDKKTKEWALPGGYAEVGLSPKENIQKEVLEETGLIVQVNDLLGVFDTNLRKDIPQVYQYYKMIFSCSIIKGSFVENNETSNMAFFALDSLPKLSVKRTTREQLACLQQQGNTYFE
ncbi:NUDIX hydrolase N-terminal domain-containing protein [Enterococcus thailandicus]|uniref:NUDIX hydrolase N-terminal domain-containing protein n=1 Tax=Enterococcus thailandicus TaxID=417368 RepID=UPI0022EBFC6C|nr:NUDIX hydrolase N-terminal domain-containing protein [Enterococcus thailandicus]MDA3974026.1 NUDIX hydrolase N-terminal domain-containing protein [Enterococcus thailandicus]MDA3976812.1 NUDIX hydrolase N-terminal domain-containing protein [Enterococcus thailandicus]MDA3981480.1 NUDIX hydrolase N-terminal domain-containing protein [Enterococcus thailandicus]